MSHFFVAIGTNGFGLGVGGLLKPKLSAAPWLLIAQMFLFALSAL